MKKTVHVCWMTGKEKAAGLAKAPKKQADK